MKQQKRRKPERLLAALTLVLVMAFSVFGHADFARAAKDDTTIAVKNVDPGSTVRAYQIIKRDLKTGKWLNISGQNLSGVQNGGFFEDDFEPTPSEIAKIANAQNLAKLNPIDLLYDGTTGDYTRDTGDSGMWLVMVAPSSTSEEVKVYNPMLVSVNYDYEADPSDPPLTGGEVDSNDSFQIGGSVAYAKSTKPSLDKTIVNKKDNEYVRWDDETNKGDTLAVGDVIEFEIKTTVPAYSEVYDNNRLTYTVTDEVSKGLDAPYDIEIKDETGKKLTTAGYTLTKNDRGFVVRLTNSYLMRNSTAASELVITYKAKLNKNAENGFDENTNTATLTYSNNPNGDTSYEKETTHHYTFDIDGEVIKVAAETDVIAQVTENDGYGRPLEGAKFQLYKKDGTKVGDEITTDTTGLMQWFGLDAGEYYIKETDAPSGFVLNETPISVVIKAELDEETGELKSYNITIAGVYTTTYTMKNGKVEESGKRAYINNIPNGALPSTGGNTALIVILLGSVVILASFVMIFSKMRREKR